MKLRRVAVANPPANRPLMVYDGECNFCRFWIARFRETTGDRVAFRRSQQAARRFPEIPQNAFQNAVQFIEPDGSVESGADAIFRAYEISKREPRLLAAARATPGFEKIARAAYRFIAKHRTTFSMLTRWLWGRAFRKPTFFIARWIFLRLLGAIYFAAFVSLLVQIRGLVGKRGILPAAQYLDAASAQIDSASERWHLLPTIFWFGASDAALVGACAAGAVISLAVVLDFAPSISLILLWALYLSLSTVCRVFLGYQWDVLLLETGFLSIFLIPPFSLQPGLRENSLSTRIARALLLWLLFRLTFESGAVKLTSHDPTWRDLTALKYHYETQPLPIWTSWYADQAPLAMQKFSVLAMFAVELAAPFTIIAPARLRRAGCAAMIALQALIASTGNYCFFNLLTVSLCVLTLDDDVWPKRWRKLVRAPLPKMESRAIAWPLFITAPVATTSVLVTSMLLASVFHTSIRWPKFLSEIHRALAPLRTLNGYGLFAVMTTERPEIIVEGSNDGENWMPYEFKWKPGDVTRRPRLVAPHQPRLDWQMWFAALGSVPENWIYFFLMRLLEGSPDVLALLEKNPFPDAPPHYVRAMLYDYHFTRYGDAANDRRAWWKREQKGLFIPPVALRKKSEDAPFSSAPSGAE